jgi:NAD(P)-dependent dehydrogenase (short-subunit alcohol dehydrogenase family)
VKRILVTGANKGIGLAIVEAILKEHEGTFVYLASRDAERGRAAASKLGSGLAARVEVVALDVGTDSSVAAAAAHVGRSLGAERLYGIVNNAGIGSQSGDFAAVVETNLFGIHRVCEAFLPLLEPKGGRIVNVTSASGPLFVADCSAEMQRFFLDDKMTWERLVALVDDAKRIAGNPSAFAARGLGDGSAYGFSKACANTYTMILAREHPSLVVNACTPGFIATDMTQHYADSQGKSPAEMGMKTPAEGARAPMHLLFGTLEGSGRYYGSDAKRSPLDRYRAPGSPEFAG